MRRSWRSASQAAVATGGGAGEHSAATAKKKKKRKVVGFTGRSGECAVSGGGSSFGPRRRGPVTFPGEQITGLKGNAIMISWNGPANHVGTEHCGTEYVDWKADKGGKKKK